MANKALFKTSRGKVSPPADTRNLAGGTAYGMADSHALAQAVVTGCFGRTFYASASEQLEAVLKLAHRVDSEYLAKCAVYGREKGYMKDSPALLVALLAARAGHPVVESVREKDAAFHEAAFGRVIDNVKMLRTYVQMVRSGVTGRKSFGTASKRLIAKWLNSREHDYLFRSNTGQNPSLKDIIKMVHPKPWGQISNAFYGYLVGKEHNPSDLPELVRLYEAFKAKETGEMPDLPFMMLSALDLTEKQWEQIALRASWQTIRMNLNTFLRHKVFGNPLVVREIASKLTNRESIKKARVFPYQLMVAFGHCSPEMPMEIKIALQQAMEIATENVPAVQGWVVVCPDVSGSMSAAVTGERKGATSAVTCRDVAALITATLLRKNVNSGVLPFSDQVYRMQLNPLDSIMTNAQKLAQLPPGGTSISLPLKHMNAMATKADLVVYVSDSESWMDSRPSYRGTALMEQWNLFKVGNPEARLVCIDLAPNATTQAIEREDILNIGGFSDNVFEVISRFSKGELDALHWTGVIEGITL